MNETALNAALYKKFIQPTQRPRKKYVGVEIEMPLVNLTRQPVDFDLIHAMTAAFMERFDFTLAQRDDNGDVYSVSSPENGDNLSFDCSYNTLELSFGLIEDINLLDQRFRTYVGWIQDYLRPHQHLLTGMGVNPHHSCNRSEPVPNGRYRMLFHHLASYKKYANRMAFHNNPDFGLYSCASQVQLDVEEQTLPEVLHTFSLLEPLKALLFSNALWEEDPDLLCVRDHFWKHSLHGLNPHNVDVYAAEPADSAEVLEYIKTMSMFCVERGDRYLNFEPLPLRQYFDGRTVTGEYFDGNAYRTMEFTPELEDLAWLRSYKFVDVTYRGTVEFRSMCCQPLAEAMAPAAFHAGLMEMVPQLKQLLEQDRVLYHHGYDAAELRDLFIRRPFPDFAEPDALVNLLLQVLDLATQGLEKRGFQEQAYLQPLYRRAKALQNPASHMAAGLQAGQSLESFILDYASLEG